MLPFSKSLICVKPPDGGSLPWLPTDAPNLLAWFDPNNSSTITLDGNNRVSLATTVNSSSYTLTNTINTARRFTLESVGGKNTFKSISNASTGEYAKISSFGFTHSSPFSVAIVYSSISSIDGTALFQFGNGGANTPTGRILISHNSSKVLANRPIAGNILFTPNIALSTTLKTLIITYSGVSNTSGLTLYVDGSNPSIPASNHSANFTTDQYNYLGAAGTTSPSNVGGRNIGDFIVFNSILDSTNRDKITGYLSHKWGITASLPVGHPYKISPP